MSVSWADHLESTPVVSPNVVCSLRGLEGPRDLYGEPLFKLKSQAGNMTGASPGENKVTETFF